MEPFAGEPNFVHGFIGSSQKGFGVCAVIGIHDYA